MWNIAAKRTHSEIWCGSSRLRIHNKRPPKGYSWVGGLLTKAQGTWRLETIWPEVWSSVPWCSQESKAAMGNRKTPITSCTSDERHHDIPTGEVEDFDVLFRSARKKLWVVTVTNSTAKAPPQKSCSVGRATFSEENSKANTNVRISKVHSHEDQLANRGLHLWHHWHTRPYLSAKL